MPCKTGSHIPVFQFPKCDNDRNVPSDRWSLLNTLTWKRVKYKQLQESLVREVITFSHLNSVKPYAYYRNIIRQVSLTSYGPDLVVEDKYLVMAAKLVHGFKCSPCICGWVIALHTCQATHIEPTACINVTPWRKSEKKKEKWFVYFCKWRERVWIILCEKFSLLLIHKEIKWQQCSSTQVPTYAMSYCCAWISIV